MATATHVGPILVSGLSVQGHAAPLPNTTLLVNNAGTGYMYGCGPAPGTNGELIFAVCDSTGANLTNVLGLEGSGDAHFYGRVFMDSDLSVAGMLTASNLTITDIANFNFNLNVGGDAQFAGNVGVTGALEATGPLHAYGGIDTEQIYVGQTPAVTGAKVLRLSTGPATDVCIIQAETLGGVYDQTLLINPLGGEVQIGSGVFIDYEGNLEAQRGDYTSLFVNGSQVLTSAELPPAGIPYPPPGVGVSTGTAWGASINPADLPRLSTPNTFTKAITVTGGANLNGGVSTPALYITGLTPSGQILTDTVSTFIDCGGTGRLLLNYNHNPAGIGFGNNGAGVPVVVFDSSGGANFAGAISYGNTSKGVFTSVTSSVFVDSYGANPTTDGTFQFRTARSDGSNLRQILSVDSNGNTRIDGVLSSAGSISTAGAFVSQLNTAQICYVPGTAIFVGQSNAAAASSVRLQGINSDLGRNWVYIDCSEINAAPLVSINSSARITGSLGIGPAQGTTANQTTIDNPDPNSTRFVSFGHTNTSAGGYSITGYSLDVSTRAVEYIHCYDDGTAYHVTTAGALYVNGGATIGAGISAAAVGVGAQSPQLLLSDDGATSFIDGGGSGRIFLNYNRTGGVVHVVGTFEVVGTKTFAVPHPLDESKDLRHACLEGPENGVYYRGEATTKKGTAEVTLPDYFEALTFKEDRSVMLTQKLHPGDSVLAMLAATPISKGKFIIVSSVPATIVAWEVKAVRRIGVDRLAVVRDRFVHPTKEDA